MAKLGRVSGRCRRLLDDRPSRSSRCSDAQAQRVLHRRLSGVAGAAADGVRLAKREAAGCDPAGKTSAAVRSMAASPNSLSLTLSGRPTLYAGSEGGASWSRARRFRSVATLDPCNCVALAVAVRRRLDPTAGPIVRGLPRVCSHSARGLPAQDLERRNILAAALEVVHDQARRRRLPRERWTSPSVPHARRRIALVELERRRAPRPRWCSAESAPRPAR